MNSVFHAPAPAAESRFPLSFAQERMWFLYRLAPANASYHVGMALRCVGMLDAEGLHWALSGVVRRHDVLRTVFGEHEGISYQRVDDSFDLNFEIIDLEPEQLSEFCRAEAIKPFCLESAPGIRAVLLRLSEHDHVLQITLHHIISDGWSINILLFETVQLYEAFLSGSMRSLPPLQLQYRQFAAEERAALLKNEMESDLTYWRKQLEGMVPTQLPADRTPRSGQTNLGNKLSLSLHSELFGRIQELSRKEGLTLFMVLVAGLQIVMARWMGQEDIAVGTAVANRKSAEQESLIGLFVNTLVIRTSLSGNPTVRELCKRVRHVCLGAYAHQDLPFDSLVIELNPERNLKRNPLFQTMFTLENAPEPHVQLPGLRLEPMVLDWGASAFDMALSVWEAKGRLEGWLEFSTGIFEAPTMKRFWEHWGHILRDMANDPDKEITNLEMLGPEEQRQILEEWGHGERVESTGGSLQSRFEEYVARTPEAVAVQHGSRRLSYIDLERRTNQTANYLKKFGVGPEVLVGVCIQRSLDMIVALLGVLKAGGAYVPLDPEYPEGRLAFMLEDTRATIVITHTGVRDRIPSGYQGRLIDLQQDWREISSQNTDKPEVEVGEDNLAYVIYTSGSTGKPKGVCVPHRGVMRLIKCKDYAHFGPEEVMLQFAPLAFDASTLEIWGSLLNGGRLAIMDAGPRTTQEIGEAVSYYGVTMLWLTAGLFHTLVDDQLEKLKHVRQVLAGGDVLSVEHVARYLAAMRENGALINGYGPTECTTFTCCYRMNKQQTTGARVPIGRPIGNTRIYVLNGHMQPVGVGEPGELYIGGEGLARGYLNWPELTAERFVPNNFATQSGERLYRSGDLVCWQFDGTLQFIGRTDNQLKLRGYRIELGEVEAALAKISGVNEAAVIAVEGRTGDKLLVGYVAGNPGSLPSSAELQRHLRQWLPEYMIPGVLLEMEQLPLTANGKLDRRFLSGIDLGELRQEPEYVAPRTKTEELVSAIFCEVLGAERVGIYDNFFHLGGHSLLASKVMLRLEETFQVKVPLARLFEAPTTEELAGTVEETLLAEIEQLSEQEATHLGGANGSAE
jgi:amino acid adenylation domain-containing protein